MLLAKGGEGVQGGWGRLLNVTRIEAEMSSQRAREMWSKMAEPHPAVIVFSVWAAAELCQLCPTVPEEGEGPSPILGAVTLAWSVASEISSSAEHAPSRRKIDRQRYRERKISDGRIRSFLSLTHVHTHTHACVHTYTHTRRDTHTHTLTCAQTHTCTDTHSLSETKRLSDVT